MTESLLFLIVRYFVQQSNACGQLGQSYQDYHCPAHEKHMECDVDPKMEITAITHATWYGAPGVLLEKPARQIDAYFK